MKNKLILIFSLLVSITAIAQETKQRFSLEEAISFALENNRTAKNASRDIEAAKQQKWETTAAGLPQLNAAVDYQNSIKQQLQVVEASAFGGPQGEYTAIALGLEQSLIGSATLSQLLFDGSYIVGLQSAKVYLEISKNAKTKTDLEVRKAVVNAYGNVLLTEESVTILERNKLALQKNLDETTKIYENGLEEEESVEQLKITLSTINSTLNNSIRLKKVAYQMLNITLGLDIENETVLTDNLETLTAQNIDLAFTNDPFSIENTIDYKIAENDKTSKELLLKLEKYKNLPTLSAFLSGGYASYSPEFTFLDSDQKYYGFGIFGAKLSIPIFTSGASNSKIQRAKINLEKAEDDLTETEQQLKLQIASAKSDYQFAIEEYSIKKENLNLAERIEKKNQTKFFEGIASSFELRQAQTQLYTAQQEFLQAMLNVINNKVALETITNQEL
ncbi:TolC family protein [Algibacter amylolyticus]|uniref:TolC family protein n=1 Tax=Algibacter amylolyticus TaxID=1608400 RepID=A0A5M7BFE4_9FLAO|nr:TolC family protein [Algibacter amylolyticus]KAA5827693.1 TolC family protein [Algibacter amylolyticus]MBB5266910.1 outer membrane protein TolC [Algibacter amylolyticus]TSJ81938.1 TolC family protein [Algibacter amylolyticus]